MSLPSTAPSAKAAAATTARVVSTASGTSKRARSAARVPAARARSSSGATSRTPTPPGRGPGGEVALLARTALEDADAAGPRAHLQHVGPVGDQLLGAGEEPVEVVVGATVGERVPGAVEDPDDDRSPGDVEAGPAQAQQHVACLPEGGRRAAGTGLGRRAGGQGGPMAGRTRRW